MRRKEEHERGAVIPIVALSLGFLVIMTAFTVDLGRMMLRRRDMQSVADVVSLDLARRVDGRTVDQIESDPAWVAQQHLSAERNNFPLTGTRVLNVQLGHVITPHTFVRDFGASVPNAVKVTAFDHVDYFFAPGGGDVNRFATAIGNGPAPPPSLPPGTPPGTPICLPGTCPPPCDPSGCPPCTSSCPPPCLPSGCPAVTPTPPLTASSLDYQIGSFLASASFTPQRTGLLNQVLGRALGSGGGLTLDAVGYQGLAAGSVTVRQITTQMGLASPSSFFTGTINARRFFLASAQALAANGGSVAAVNALNAMAATVSSSSTFSGSALIAGGSTFSATASQGGTSAADTSLNVLNLVEGAAFLINGTNVISVPNLNLGVPGLTTTSIQLSVIEGPRFLPKRVVDQSDSTSQVHLVLTAGVDSAFVSALIPGGRITGTITVDVTTGSATGTPTQITCPSNASTIPPQARVAVSTAPLGAVAGETLTMSATLPLFGVTNVLSTTVNNATVGATSSGGTGVFGYPDQFMPPPKYPGTTQRVGGGDLNLSSALGATSANSTVLGGTISQSNLLIAFNTQMTSSIAPSLITSALPFIGSSIGIEIGGADIGANELHCDGPILVN